MSRVNSVNYWPKKTPRPSSAGLILIPEAIALKTKEYGTAFIFTEPESFRFEDIQLAECLLQYNLGHFVEKQVGFGFAAILRGEHSGFGELLGFGSKVWRWSGAMPGIPSTLGRILHSSTSTAPSSIDFNFFTNTTLFAFLKNISHYG